MKIGILVVIMAIVGAVSACSSSDGGSKAKSGIGYGTSISTIAKKIGCTDLHKVSADGSLDLGFKPLDEQECTIEGHALDITTVKNKTQMGEMLAISKSLVESFGIEVYGAKGDGWVATVETNDTSKDPSPSVQKTISQEIVDKIGGTVVHYGSSSPTDAASQQTPQSTGSPTLQPATAIEESRAAEAAHTAAVGSPGSLPGGVKVTFTDLQAAGDDSGPLLKVKIHVENTSSDDSAVPNVGIVCANSSYKHPGEYQAGSTISLGGELPASSYRDGVLFLMLPGDTRTGPPAPRCATPAYIETTPLTYTGDVEPSVRVPIPNSIVADLNAEIGS